MRPTTQAARAQVRESCACSRHLQQPGAYWLGKVVLVFFVVGYFFQPIARGQVKEVRRVLIFYEMGLSSPGVELVDQGIRAALRNSPYQIELYREYLETTLFPDPAKQQEFRQWYVHKYRNLKPDLLIAAGPSPLKFLLDSHERFFSGVPVVFCGTSKEQADYPRLDSQFTGIWEKFEPAKTLEVALLLQPGTRHLVVVGGTNSFDRHLEALAKEDLRGYMSGLDVTYLTDLTMPELLEKLHRLPEHTVVLLTDVAEDAAGTKFVSGTQSTPMMTSAANAPLFTLADVDFGHGEVGGDFISFAKEGQITGDIALRILKGEKPQDIPVVDGANVYMFDWRALKRWHMEEAGLPVGSIIFNRPPNAWEIYKRYVVAAILLVLLQALIIAGLLWQRARRKKIEAELRESEGRFRLVANSAPVMIWMSGIDKLCTYFNQPWLEFTGRTLEEESGNGWAQGVHTNDLQNCWETYSKSSDQRKPFQMEYRLRRSDGEYRWVFDQGVPRFNADGSFVGYIGTCIDVTERKAAEETLSSIGRKLIEAHEEERTRIARELHDDFNQRITLLAVSLTGLAKALPVRNGHFSGALREAIEQVGELGHDMQQLAHRLHSSKLEYLGLAAACAGFCRELSDRQKIEIAFHSEGIPKKLPQEIALCLFRILQEALQNAVKHSGVRDFQVSLIGGLYEIKLTVQDSGIGFDPGEAIKGPGIGLTSMKERLKLVDGELLLDSQLRRGTTIHARVPFAAKATAAKSGS